jgi:hypothetical protein
MKENQLRKLYCERRFSMMEVARELNVTHAKVWYWLKKFNIPRRSWSESSYIKQNFDGDPFQVCESIGLEKRELFIAGLLLYWAEGTKGKHSIQIANLDHRMLVIFLRFLREICQIRERRLFLYVRVYKDFSLQGAREYWTKLLSISSDRVFVYCHTDKRSLKNRQWSPYGLATLEFHNIKLKQWLDASIEKLIQELLESNLCETKGLNRINSLKDSSLCSE